MIKVLLLVPSVKISRNIALFERMRMAIKNVGGILCYDEDLATTLEAAGQFNELDAQDWSMLARRQLKAVEECDIAIVDVTDKASFGAGYLASEVLHANKPTLFLMHKASSHGSLISGLRHPALYRRQYEESNVEKVIEKFISQFESPDEVKSVKVVNGESK